MVIGNMVKYDTYSMWVELMNNLHFKVRGELYDKVRVPVTQPIMTTYRVVKPSIELLWY